MPPIRLATIRGFDEQNHALGLYWLACDSSMRRICYFSGCGYKLANDGHDTRAIQQYLGHKNISHTVRYTELAADRFNGFWRD